jgi:DNA-binding MarR family transcriptional regulator
LFVKDLTLVSSTNSCKLQLSAVEYHQEVYVMIILDSSQRLRETTRLLIRKMGVLERSEAVCCGITLTQCHAIVETGRRQQISVNELSELLNLDKSTVSRTVEQLVSNDILVREPDQNDRRYVSLRLTGKGEELFENIEQRMQAYFAEILVSIPEEKREQVIESLQLFSEALHNKRCC